MFLKIIVIFIVLCSFYFVCQSYLIDNVEVQEITLINGKKLIRQIRDVNVTQIENTASVKLYGKWGKWSNCRKCVKFRRRSCLSQSQNCLKVYEKKRCHIPRCKRKRNNRKYRSKSLRKNIKESDHLYYNWSEWSTCSHQCITWRQRYCRFPGTCLHDRDVEMGYCYRENTPCHTWIQSVLDRQAQAQNRKYTYESDSNGRKRKKVKYKSRKCGIPYRTKKKRARYSTSGMLKIMGGSIAKKKKWPWHVALLNYNKEVYCGGTLIAPDWVLTAAHCLRRTLYVRLNEYDTSYSDGSEIEYRIIKMYRHPKYNKITSDSDIAMLKLPKSVPLPYACLPKNMSLPTGHNCTIVGWGKTSPHDYNGSNILREAQIPIVEKSVCERSYRFYAITDNMLCAGYRNGGVDTCLGDSGGGFMCLPQGKRFGWTIQGITSFGEGCGKRNKYGIYTDVRKYLSWIQNKF